jgi:hypothetical protein
MAPKRKRQASGSKRQAPAMPKPQVVQSARSSGGARTGQPRNSASYTQKKRKTAENVAKVKSQRALNKETSVAVAAIHAHITETLQGQASGSASASVPGAKNAKGQYEVKHWSGDLKQHVAFLVKQLLEMPLYAPPRESRYKAKPTTVKRPKTVSLANVAKLLCIPYTTLTGWMKQGSHERVAGRPPAISPEVVKRIVAQNKIATDRGALPGQQELVDSTVHLEFDERKENRQKGAFVKKGSKVPTTRTVVRTLERAGIVVLSEEQVQQTTDARVVAEENVRNYLSLYAIMKRYTKKLHGRRLLNTDGTTVVLNGTTGKIMSYMAHKASLDAQRKKNRRGARTNQGKKKNVFVRIKLLSTTTAEGDVVCPLFYVRAKNAKLQEPEVITVSHMVCVCKCIYWSDSEVVTCLRGVLYSCPT